MVLSTAFSQMFGIDYPIVSAPMDLIAGAVRFSSVAAAAGWRGASVPFYTARIAVSVLAACCAIPVITSAAGRTALTRPAA